jgi:hypothetical protein
MKKVTGIPMMGRRRGGGLGYRFFLGGRLTFHGGNSTSRTSTIAFIGPTPHELHRRTRSHATTDPVLDLPPVWGGCTSMPRRFLAVVVQLLAWAGETGNCSSAGGTHSTGRGLGQPLPFGANDAQRLLELRAQGSVVGGDLPQPFLGQFEAGQ